MSEADIKVEVSLYDPTEDKGGLRLVEQFDYVAEANHRAETVRQAVLSRQSFEFQGVLVNPALYRLLSVEVAVAEFGKKKGK